MKAIVGLGNPGEKYAHTRHNAGFDTIELISARLEIPIKKLKCHATVGEGLADGERVVLIKPQTFMNLSGMTVSEALSWYKLTPQEMLLIVDDIDLPFGTVRVRGKGMPRFKSDNRGDLLVHVDVVVPRNLTKSQRELMEKLAVELGDQISKKRTPFQRLRDALS